MVAGKVGTIELFKFVTGEWVGACDSEGALDGMVDRVGDAVGV